MLSADHIVRRGEAVQYLYPSSAALPWSTGRNWQKLDCGPFSGPNWLIMRQSKGKFPRRPNRELNPPNRDGKPPNRKGPGKRPRLAFAAASIPISSWLQSVGGRFLRPGPPRLGGHDNRDRARGMRSARRSDVLWTNPRLPRPGRTAGSSGSVCTAAQPLTQNRALRKWLNIFAARRPGNNRTFSWFGRNPSGSLPGRRLGSR